MKNPLIEQLLEHMTADLETAIEDQEPEMLKAIQKLRADRPDDDEKPLVFSVSLSGKLNLDKNTVETQFAFSVKTTVKEKHTLSDPLQTKLPLDDLREFAEKHGATVTINTGGDEFEV